VVRSGNQGINDGGGWGGSEAKGGVSGDGRRLEEGDERGRGVAVGEIYISASRHKCDVPLEWEARPGDDGIELDGRRIQLFNAATYDASWPATGRIPRYVVMLVMKDGREDRY
jgi:hypothetical protein